VQTASLVLLGFAFRVPLNPPAPSPVRLLAAEGKRMWRIWIPTLAGVSEQIHPGTGINRMPGG
tara:strand:- start:621 stop:809 length:189 start_codon:yes stop_codon:yes gene_type:complete